MTTTNDDTQRSQDKLSMAASQTQGRHFQHVWDPKYYPKYWPACDHINLVFVETSSFIAFIDPRIHRISAVGDRTIDKGSRTLGARSLPPTDLNMFSSFPLAKPHDAVVEHGE